tara:strand:+ start:398 stop:901 length:504 start_codon:yes stop_codon:yes gene_type:complete
MTKTETKVSNKVSSAIRNLKRKLKDKYEGPQCTTYFIKEFGESINNALNAGVIPEVDVNAKFEEWRKDNKTASYEETVDYMASLTSSNVNIKSLWNNSKDIGRFNGTPWIKYVKEIEVKLNDPSIYAAIADLYGNFISKFEVTEKKVSKDQQRIAELEEKLKAATAK